MLFGSIYLQYWDSVVVHYLEEDFHSVGEVNMVVLGGGVKYVQKNSLFECKNPLIWREIYMFFNNSLNRCDIIMRDGLKLVYFYALSYYVYWIVHRTFWVPIVLPNGPNQLIIERNNAIKSTKVIRQNINTLPHDRIKLERKLK